MPVTEGRQADVRVIAYRALAQSIRDQIEQGTFGREGRLPTEIDLSEAHGVSRQTVRRALQDLVTEGLVYRVQGRGTFVSMPSAQQQLHHVRALGTLDDLLAVPTGSQVEVVEPLRPCISVEAAGVMRLNSDQVFGALTKRTADGVTLAFSRLWFPPQVGRPMTADGFLGEADLKHDEPVVSAVDRVAPKPIAFVQQSVSAVTADVEARALLALDEHAPVLRIDRLYSDRDDHPLALATSYFSAGHYSYRLQMRRAPD